MSSESSSTSSRDLLPCVKAQNGVSLVSHVSVVFHMSDQIVRPLGAAQESVR